MHTVNLNDEQYEYIQGLLEAGIDSWNTYADFAEDDDQEDVDKEEAILRSLCDLFNVEF